MSLSTSLMSRPAAHLLRNEAGNGHTWSGIDLQHIHLVLTVLILRDDIVDADDTIGMEDIVDAGCGLCHLFCSLRRETGWSDFLYLTIVLGIIVEELIAGYHLCSWQDNSLLGCLVDALKSQYHRGTLQSSPRCSP